MGWLWTSGRLYIFTIPYGRLWMSFNLIYGSDHMNFPFSHMLLVLMMMKIICVSESDPAAHCKKTEHTSWRALWDNDTPISKLKLLSDRVTSTETEGLTWRRSKKWELIFSTQCRKQLVSVKLKNNNKFKSPKATIVRNSAPMQNVRATSVTKNDNNDDFNDGDRQKNRQSWWFEWQSSTYLFLTPPHLSFCSSISAHQLRSSDHKYIMNIELDSSDDDDDFHHGAEWWWCSSTSNPVELHKGGVALPRLAWPPSLM